MTTDTLPAEVRELTDEYERLRAAWDRWVTFGPYPGGAWAWRPRSVVNDREGTAHAARRLNEITFILRDLGWRRVQWGETAAWVGSDDEA